MYQEGTPSQRATASSRCALPAIAMDHFYYKSRLYLIVCDYFSKFPFIFQAKSTSFANIKEQLEELFRLEDTPDEIMSDNAPPLAAKSLTAFFQVLVSNTPPHHQTTPRVMASLRDKFRLERLMEKVNSTERSFQEALTSLRATPIAEGIPLPAEILHGRSLVTRKAISVDLTAVQQHLIASQAKYIKQHDKAR